VTGMKQMKNKRGESYIDTCISTVIIIGIITVAINLFEFVKLKVELDQIADDLITTAIYSGCFNEEFQNCNTAMQNDYFTYILDYGADEYFNSVKKSVQLGDRMWVRVSEETEIKGMGAFKIPVTISVKRSGISERYWKSGE